MNHRNQTLIVVALLALCSCSSTNGDSRTFEVNNRFTIDVPPGTGETKAWIALPDDREELQEIRNLAIRAESAPGSSVATRQVRDANGNRFLYLDLADSGGRHVTIDTQFEVVREEAVHSIDASSTRPITKAERERMAADLGENAEIVFTPEVTRAAAMVVGSETNPVRQARLLYDWTLDHVQYWVKDPGRWKSSGVGSSTYCFEQCTGNCTDFHSLYAAAARSIGLPTRMVYGSFFKEPLDGGDRDQSYHCWIEFWAPDLGWVPLDVAVADLYVDDFKVTEANAELVSLTLADGYAGPDAERVDYYFGNLDARRVTWNRGRDLQLDPSPRAGAINALPKAHVEFDGVPVKEGQGWTRKLTFKEIR